MATPNDAHGPKAGCGWQQCGVKGDEGSCPFTRDETVRFAHKIAETAKACKHEWRLADLKYVTPDLGKLYEQDRHFMFYCIHCREITKDILKHQTVKTSRENLPQQG